MFCNECGTENSDDARFCSKCGAKQVIASKSKNEAQMITQRIQQQKTSSVEITKNDFSQKSQIITIILSILFGIFGIHNFYVGKKGKGFWQLLLAFLPSVVFSIVLLAKATNRSLHPTFYAEGWFALLVALEVVCLIIDAIWAFVDFLKLMDGRYTDKQGKILRPVVFYVKKDM